MGKLTFLCFLKLWDGNLVIFLLGIFQPIWSTGQSSTEDGPYNWQKQVSFNLILGETGIDFLKNISRFQVL